MGGTGLQKNPEYVIKSELKDRTLYCPNEFVHDCSCSAIGLREVWVYFRIGSTNCFAFKLSFKRFLLYKTGFEVKSRTNLNAQNFLFLSVSLKRVNVLFKECKLFVQRRRYNYHCRCLFSYWSGLIRLCISANRRKEALRLLMCLGDLCLIKDPQTWGEYRGL